MNPLYEHSSVTVREIAGPTADGFWSARTVEKDGIEREIGGYEITEDGSYVFSDLHVDVADWA